MPMRLDFRALAALSLLIALLAGSHARAEGTQLHMRTGALNAMLGGAAQVESFMAVPILDFEAELLSESRKSHVFHVTFANDMATAQTKYFYAGYSRRYYIWGTQGARINVADSTTMIEATQRKRWYAGWEVGMGQVQAQVINLSLNITSTVLEGGGNIGLIYQFTRDFGLVTHAGFGYGYGFSSVSVTGMFIRLLVGATYYM